jgi:hypothetical protein
MIKPRHLKFASFSWDEENRLLNIIQSSDNKFVKGSISMNKTYLYSALRYMVRVSQYMWGRKRGKR